MDRRPLLAWVIEQLGTHERPPGVLANRLRHVADQLDAITTNKEEPPWGEARAAAHRAQAEAAHEAAAEHDRQQRLARAARLDVQPATTLDARDAGRDAA